MSSITSEIKLRIKAEGEAVFQGLSAKLNNLANQTTISSAKFKVLSNELRDVQEKTGANSIKTLKDYAASWRELANSVDIASKEFKEATAQASKFEAQAAKAQGRRGGGGGGRIGAIAAGASFLGPDELIGAAGGAALGSIIPGAGTAAGAGIGVAVGSMVIRPLRQASAAIANYNNDLNLAKITLAQASSSQEDYSRNLQIARKVSDDYATSLKETISGYAQVSVAARANGLSLKETETIYRGVVAAGIAFGKSQEDINAIVRATVQVLSKGKVSAEEMGGQIGERLPGAVAKFAAATDRTLPELAKAFEQGEVKIADFVKFAKQQLDDYDEIAKIIGDSPAKAGARLQIALDTAGENYGGFFQKIGAGLQDSLAKTISWANQSAVPIKRVATFFFNLGRDIVKILTAISKKLLEFGNGFAKIFYDLATFLPRQIAKAFGTTPEKIFGKAIGTLKEGFKQYTSNFADYFPTFEPSAGLFGTGEGATPGLDAEGAADEKEKKRKKIIDLTNEQLQLGLDTVNLERQGLDIRAEYSKFLQRELDLQKKLERGQIGVNQAILEGAQSQQQLEQAIENAFKGYGTDVIKALDEEAQARAQINILIADAQLKTKVLSEEDKRRVEINKQLAAVIEKFADILTSEELLEAIRKLREALEGAAKTGESFKDNFKASFKSIADSALNLGANLGSSLGNTFVGLGDQLAEFVTTGKASFADFARSVLLDLSKIFMRAAIFQTLKTFFPGGSAIGNFLGFANGGIMTANGPIDLRRYAAGGIANSPQMAIYGEGSRPEAYVPLPDGRTIPVTMKGGSDMGSVVVNVDASGSSVEGNGGQANALGKAIGIAVQQELIKQKRPGGLLS
jgi:lambda family phage tail tape measure protein